ncbi:29013_t:CDS:1, partial [Racocetra persica]
CTTPFAKINGWDLVLHIIKKEKETISNGTPQNIRNIIEGCWKNKPNERISLENILKMIEKEDILRKAIREKEKQLDELINEESEYSKALLEPLIKAQNQEEFQQGKDNLKGKSQEFENIFQIKEEIIELKKQLGDIKANDEKFQDAKLSPQLIHTTSGILGSQIKEEKNNYSTILTPENTSKVCIID